MLVSMTASLGVVIIIAVKASTGPLLWKKCLIVKLDNPELSLILPRSYQNPIISLGVPTQVDLANIVLAQIPDRKNRDFCKPLVPKVKQETANKNISSLAQTGAKFPACFPFLSR